MTRLSTTAFATLLSAAVSSRSPLLGRAAHAQIIKTFSPLPPPHLSNHLINMYSKLDFPTSAHLVLSLSSSSSVVAWTSLISGLVQNGHFSTALNHFSLMLCLSIMPNDYTFPCALKAAASLRRMDSGRLIHSLAIKLGQLRDCHVGCGVFDMYSKLGLCSDAQKAFDEMPDRNGVIWNAYISNSVLAARPWDAIRGFVEFRHSGVTAGPDYITICAYLNACSDVCSLRLGEQMHGYVICSGNDRDVSVANGLIDFYGKCGECGCSEKLFIQILKPNSVSWSSMVAAYEQNNEWEKAFIVFLRSREQGVAPSDFMLSSLLSACAGIAILDLGKSVHACAEKACVTGNIFVGSTLVDMYSKCGSIEDAGQAFFDMPKWNVVSWNAMLGGYAHQGQADKAVDLFNEVIFGDYGVEPNHITFVCVLAACSRAGLVETGMEILESMRMFGVNPGAEHYACVVDMLGRAGMVERAYGFILNMPMAPTVSMWGALLGACRVHNKPEVGKVAAEKLFELDPEDSGNHVLLSNTFAADGRWEEAMNVRLEMNDVGVKKGVGFSRITI
ncbi:hypothetical protein V2J09_005563 [Rumex salicifolius]